MRLSGPDAATICDRLFIPAANTFPKPSQMKGYTLAPGTWAGIDDVVLSCFRAPHSFTGEDVYEISCHGGKAIREGVLASALSSGARAAGPGEYSRRAFLNGKLDLASAEAVMDLIEAQAEKQAKAAYRQLKGDLSNAVRIRADQLYAILAHLEMLLDWDEEEERDEDRLTLTADLKEAESALRHLARRFEADVSFVKVFMSSSPEIPTSENHLFSIRCQVAPAPLSAIFPVQHATRSTSM